MFDERTKSLIDEAVKAELKNAQNNYGKKYNSVFEGYAVLKEEVEEVQEDFEFIQMKFNELWDSIRENDLDRIPVLVSQIELKARNCAMESAQVAAVCNKIIGK